MKNARFILITTLSLLAASAPLRAATFTVTSTGATGPGSLAVVLMKEADLTKRVEQAVRVVLNRPARPEETQLLVGYLQRRSDRADAACQQVIWALLTSAEMRFNH